MKLSTRLYLLISAILLLVFLGNFYITLQNTKNYLESESTTKAQDTAVSLGLSLKPLMNNKKDSEILLTINAIADSGFYKEIRLEDAYYTFNDEELIKNNSKLKGLAWNISDISIDKKMGIINIQSEELLANELEEIEGTNNLEQTSINIKDNTYTFIPSKLFKDNDYLEIKYIAAMNNKLIKTGTKIKLSKVLVKNTRDVKFDNVPLWFINLVNINLEEKKVEISDGWKTTAVLFVSANPGIAYEKLYIQLEDVFKYSILSFIISIISLYFFLQLILKPLRKIEQLANDISNGDFKQISILPKAKELKTVTLAMNTMSKKIKDIISQLNNDVEEKSKKLNTDELTLLQLEQSFLSDLKNMFVEKKDGFIGFVKIENLEEYSKMNTKDDVDNYIIKCAKILDSSKDVNTYRIFGSQFAIIIYKNDLKEINLILNEIKNKFISLSKEINSNNIIHIGISKLNKYSTVDSMINSSKEAYEMAKLVGPNEYTFKDNDEYAKDPQEWKELVSKIINNADFTLEYINNIICTNTNKLLMKEVFSSIKDNNKNIPIGTFVAIAQEYNKIVQFDMEVINKVIKFIKTNDINYKILVNLSIESIKNNNFKTFVVNILKENDNIANKLVFSITAYNVQASKDDFKNFTKIIQKFKAFMMIKRYEAKFIESKDINELKPNYIRLSREYTKDISKDETKKSLVDSVCKITTLIDVDIYCEEVKDDNDYKLLSNMNIKGTIR